MNKLEFHGLSGLIAQQRFWLRIQRVVNERIDEITRRHKILRNFDMFLAMSDHVLNDIGLIRDDIRADLLRYRLTGQTPSYNQ